MRKVISGAFVSLDGVMQAPGGPQEDPTLGFELGHEVRRDALAHGADMEGLGRAA